MIDALFWYTGLAAWALIMFGVVAALAIEAHDRSIARRGRAFEPALRNPKSPAMSSGSSRARP
jgi:hypothetical protein